MENQEKWLTCRRKGKVYLLARDERAYYAIEVNKRLNYAVEEQLAQHNISEKLLQELLLSYQYFSKNSLRGVAVGGNYAGSTISLYPKTENRSDYVLELDYDTEFLESFFADVPRFQAPQKVSGGKKKSGKEDDWRKSAQDQELFKKLKIVPTVCTVLNVCVAIAYVLTGRWFWFTLCWLFMAAEFCLIIFMPAYFTLAFPKKTKKRNALELQMPLIAMAAIMVFRNDVNILSDGAFWITMLIGGIVGLLIYPFLIDLHKDKGAIFTAILMGAFVGMYFIGQGNQVYDFSEPDRYVLVVENLHKSGGKAKNSYCTVTLPDGREVSLDIPGSLYNSLEIGDEVLVVRSDGAFGIEYANAYPVE